jgi:NAD+ synthase
MINLTIDTTAVKRIITDFIQKQTSQAGYTRAVINLSGGIDSALVCTLTAEALGPHNVLALFLPYRTSSPDSRAHARLVSSTLGVQSINIPITSMARPLFERFPEMNQVRRGNVMARLRMIVLYDQSEAFHGLPIGTSNKTEILLGYSTVYGDSACAINPLGDLYKTQVRQLARAVGVPEPIIEKPPSADLWEGQTDEGELGFTYAEVDQLLALLVDRRASLAECLEASFSADFIRDVITRIRRTRFKRTLPPVALLSKQVV